MTAVSFVAMYVLMYAMVDSFANVYPNYNQFYMAGLMAAPMLLIELAFMHGMYHGKKLNAAITVFGVAAIIGFFMLVRTQAAVGDEQFLRSMIPHHASALLMCERAQLTDPEVQALCRNIIKGQQTEIDWMKGKLEEIGSGEKQAAGHP